jgi:hypothetical protein
MGFLHGGYDSLWIPGKIFIFAGSEWVALMPPIAALFCPLPQEASVIQHRDPKALRSQVP